MDVIDLLVHDHREVSRLFGNFHRASRHETLDEIAKEIVHELSVHAAVEEQFVYPVVRSKVSGGSEMVDHGIEEHHQVKRLLSDLEKDAPGKASFGKTMEKVVDAVHEHVSDEEGEVLPALKESTSADFRRQLGELVEKAKAVVPTHPHPMVPGTATAQMVAGPWAALVDRIRDLVA